MWWYYAIEIDWKIAHIYKLFQPVQSFLLISIFLVVITYTLYQCCLLASWIISCHFAKKLFLCPCCAVHYTLLKRRIHPWYSWYCLKPSAIKINLWKYKIKSKFCKELQFYVNGKHFSNSVSSCLSVCAPDVRFICMNSFRTSIDRFPFLLENKLWNWKDAERVLCSVEWDIRFSFLPLCSSASAWDQE